MGIWRKRLWRSKRGQSILEYLVITTVVVVAILAIRQTVSARTNETYQKAAQRVGDARAALDNNFNVKAH